MSFVIRSIKEMKYSNIFKRIKLLGFFLLVSLVVSSCGGGSSDSPSNNNPDNSGTNGSTPGDNNNGGVPSGEAPVFESSANASFDENSIGIAYTAKATDADGDTLIYALPEGVDKDVFRIIPNTGVVAFKNPPNFEAPQDANKDNIYEVRVSVNDGAHTVLQTVQIQVLDVNDTIKNADVVIEMLDASTQGDSSLFVFEPAYIKIQPGQTVGFRLVDSGHNTVSELTPNKATGWEINYTDGEVMLQEEGVYLYYCTPHKSFGMYGIIQVGDASSNKAEAIAKANSMANQFEGLSSVNAAKLREAIAKID